MNVSIILRMKVNVGKTAADLFRTLYFLIKDYKALLACLYYGDRTKSETFCVVAEMTAVPATVDFTSSNQLQIQFELAVVFGE